MTGTKLYCSVTEAHVCEQLAQGRYLAVERPGVELATPRVANQHLNHYTPHTQASVNAADAEIYRCYYT